jgi:hypothetical protein
MYKPFARCVVLCFGGVGGCVVLCGSRSKGWWLVSHSHSEHLFVCVFVAALHGCLLPPRFARFVGRWP